MYDISNTQNLLPWQKIVKNWLPLSLKTHQGQELLKFKDEFLNAFWDLNEPSEHTLIHYSLDLNRFIAFVDEQSLLLNDFKRLQFEMFLAKAKNRQTPNAKLSAASRFRMSASVRKFVRWLYYSASYLKVEISAYIPTVPVKRPMKRALRMDELKAMVGVIGVGKKSIACRQEKNCRHKPLWTESAALRDRLFIHLLYITGMRVSEMAYIKVENMQLPENQSGSIYVIGKGKKARMVILDDLTCEIIKTYLKINQKGASHHLFFEQKPDFKDTVRFRQKVRERLQLCAREANLSGNSEISPHVLRRTFATNLLDGGADLRTVQEMLGHEQITTTQIYTNVSTQKKLEAHKKYLPKL